MIMTMKTPEDFRTLWTERFKNETERFVNETERFGDGTKRFKKVQ